MEGKARRRLARVGITAGEASRRSVAGTSHAVLGSSRRSVANTVSAGRDRLARGGITAGEASRRSVAGTSHAVLGSSRRSVANTVSAGRDRLARGGITAGEASRRSVAGTSHAVLGSSRLQSFQLGYHRASAPRQRVVGKEERASRTHSRHSDASICRALVAATRRSAGHSWPRLEAKEGRARR